MTTVALPPPWDDPRFLPSWVDLAKWTDRKLKSIALARAYAHLGGPLANLADRIRECAPQMQRYGIEHIHDPGLTIKTLFARTCKGRLCPLCATLRARRQYARTVPRFEHILTEHPRVRAALATFTVPNVAFDGLRDAADAILAGFRRLTQKTAFKQAVVGWLRAMEVTVNAETMTFHPHLHVILLLHPDYFSLSDDRYLTQQEWLALWKRCMGDEAIEIFDIRVLRPQKRDMPLSSALAEVTKYPMKPGKFFIRDGAGYRVDPGMLKPLHYGLRGKRLTASGGLLRPVAFRVDTPEDHDLTDEDFEAVLALPEEPRPFFTEDFKWNGALYVERRAPNANGALPLP